jgi:hypothetical protein
MVTRTQAAHLSKAAPPSPPTKAFTQECRILSPILKPWGKVTRQIIYGCPARIKCSPTNPLGLSNKGLNAFGYKSEIIKPDYGGH